MNTSTATPPAPVGNIPPDALTAFLDRSEGQVGQWGERDCALWVAEWLLILTGRDGGGEWRGTYGTEEECAALLRREGGIVEVMRRGVSRTGLVVTSGLPVRGDVGVVKVRIPGGGEAGLAAICVGPRRWAAMSEDGLRVIRADPFIVWTVP